MKWKDLYSKKIFFQNKGGIILNIALPLIGFLIGFISFLGIIGFGISFLITKYRKIQTNRFKKPLVISTVALIISIMIFITGINKVDTLDTSSDNSQSDQKDPITSEKTNKNGTISKNMLQKIEIGDSYKTVENILGNPQEVDKDGYMWNYKGNKQLSKDSYAVISFDFENKVEAIEQKGIINKDTTIADADGTNNFTNSKKSTGVYKEETNDNIDSAEDDKDFVQYDTEDVINSFAEKNFKFDAQLNELELNENLGTKKDGDYIALVHMNIGKTLSAKSGLGWIDKYTNYLASELATKEKDISEITFFWTMPQFADKDYNVSKYTLKRNGKKFYFESEWQDKRLLEK